MPHRFTVELVELLVYKCKSRKRSFNDQLTVKPSICGKYFYPLSKYM